MGKQKLKGKDLHAIGYRSDKVKSLAINIMSRHFKHLNKAEKLELLMETAENPEKFKNNEHLFPIAEEFMEFDVKDEFTVYNLRNDKNEYPVFGRKYIDQNTINQMDRAMRLPVAVKGALMPDAHVGYGLPIGGVFATKNEVIPYGVGLDIGCRMALTIFNAPFSFLNKQQFLFNTALKEQTHFGIGHVKTKETDHAIMVREEFKMNKLLKNLQGKAWNQLGSSGSGNHFVEFGEVILHENNILQIPAGSYIGLLSHSGSRGLGATIAGYYTRVAMDKCRLPKGTQHLAWLDLDKSEGMEYWLAMNLAGDYAKACHEVIHDRIEKAIGLKPLIKIENHHNFAWKELQADGTELIVHRKGATPAKDGELGIIPGSMTAPGFIVSGKGKESSLNSASHGAGRLMSRSKARSSVTKSAINKELKQKNITLIGGSIEEAPCVYKDIHAVIDCQNDLVNIEGIFIPKIIRMDKD